MPDVLEDTSILIDHITQALQIRNQRRLFSRDRFNRATASAVLFLLGQKPGRDAEFAEPCLILNKRSIKVRQPGDLCFPGGSVSFGLDFSLAGLLRLFFAPLMRWPHWSDWRKQRPQESRFLTLFLATGLRESFEEMRLNPFKLKFLGPLPPQPLVMFDRLIYPMVVWITGQKRFRPNWEVEKIVFVPLRELLNPIHYAAYRLKMHTPLHHGQPSEARDYPCFRYPASNDTDLLWGATYRMVTDFLNSAFDFKPPQMDTLPVVRKALNGTYLTGNR